MNSKRVPPLPRKAYTQRFAIGAFILSVAVPLEDPVSYIGAPTGPRFSFEPPI